MGRADGTLVATSVVTGGAAAAAVAAATTQLAIEVVDCPAPGVNHRVLLSLPPAATVADALAASGLPSADHAPSQTGKLRIGVWGHVRPLDTPLRDGDRVEIYRPLQVDPKQARRLRASAGRPASDSGESRRQVR